MSLFLDNNSILKKFSCCLLTACLLLLVVLAPLGARSTANAEVGTLAIGAICVATTIALGLTVVGLTNEQLSTQMENSLTTFLGDNLTAFDAGISILGNKLIFNDTARHLFYDWLSNYLDESGISADILTHTATYYNGYTVYTYAPTFAQAKQLPLYDSVTINGNTRSATYENGYVKFYRGGSTFYTTRVNNARVGILLYRDRPTSTSLYINYYYFGDMEGAQYETLSGVTLDTITTTAADTFYPNLDNYFVNPSSNTSTSFTFNVPIEQVGSIDDLGSITVDGSIGDTTGEGEATDTNILGQIPNLIQQVIDWLKGIYQAIVDWFTDFFSTLEGVLHSIFDVNSSPPPAPSLPEDVSSSDSGLASWINGLFEALHLDDLLDSIRSFWAIIAEWLGSISAFLAFYRILLTSLPRAMVLPLYASIVLGATLIFIRKFTA